MEAIAEHSSTLPLVITATPGAPRDLEAWVGAHVKMARLELQHHGAILFRGFDVTTAEHFRAALMCLLGEPLEYTEKSSPRSRVGAGIYTSTDYPPDREILPHNEQSYNATFPRYISFYCQQPSASGGQTPLADTRRVMRRIAPTLLEKLWRTGYRYTRNFGGAMQMSWQHAFNSADAQSVEAYCRRSDISFEWLGERGGKKLRTSQVRPVVGRHPDSGEMTWFNHAAFFHRSSLPPDLRELLEKVCGAKGMPHATAYGDGTEIEPESIAQLWSAYRAQERTFDWFRGDVLVIDNMLTAHGRRPYSGDRILLAAMAVPCNWTEVAVRPDDERPLSTLPSVPRPAQGLPQ
jgi:alpha-ketoglutarate-dependent taurine dioxygenase